jgi:hypothetical protein
MTPLLSQMKMNKKRGKQNNMISFRTLMNQMKRSSILFGIFLLV